MHHKINIGTKLASDCPILVDPGTKVNTAVHLLRRQGGEQETATEGLTLICLAKYLPVGRGTPPSPPPSNPRQTSRKEGEKHFEMPDCTDITGE